MPPPHLNFSPSRTGVCVLFVTVSCSAMIMFSSVQNGWSSLMMASQKGHHEVVKVLLSVDANVDLLTKVSSTSTSQDHALN